MFILNHLTLNITLILPSYQLAHHRIVQVTSWPCDELTDTRREKDFRISVKLSTSLSYNNYSIVHSSTFVNKYKRGICRSWKRKQYVTQNYSKK